MKFVSVTIILVTCCAFATFAETNDTDTSHADHQTHKTDAVSRWLQRVQEHDPERYDELVALRESDPDAFRRTMRKTRRDHRVKRKRKQSERMHQMEKKTAELVLQVHQAAAADREQAIENLRDHVTRMFDRREAGKQKDMARMERKLAEMQRRLQTRRQNRDRIIERRMEELMDQTP